MSSIIPKTIAVILSITLILLNANEKGDKYYRLSGIIMLIYILTKL